MSQKTWFSTTTTGTRVAQIFSVPALNGTSRAPQASFAGKTEDVPTKPVALFSVPALNGTSRAPLASFSGKSEADEPDGPPLFEGLRRNVGRMMR